VTDPGALGGENADLLIADVNRVRVPDVLAHPIERLHVGDRAHPHMLEGVALLIQRLAKMRV
jgi:hypothetical protein